MKIADAIRTRHILTFNNHGHLRVVEPHTYGIDKNGHAALRAYQTGGTSGSGRIPDFRFFHVAEITALSVAAQTFSGHRPGYVKGDPLFAVINAQL